MWRRIQVQCAQISEWLVKGVWGTHSLMGSTYSEIVRAFSGRFLARVQMQIVLNIYS